MSESGDSAARRGLFRRIAPWARRIGLGRKLALALAVLAVLSGIATYAAMTEVGPFTADPSSQTVFMLLNLDLVLLLMLGAVLARRIVALWAERRRGLAGSRLHVRLVLLFSLVAVTPTVLVALFSALFFNVGLQGWFSERVRTAIDESRAVAQAYLEEHRQAIAGDVLAMAASLDRAGPRLLSNKPRKFKQFVAEQANARGLTEAIVFRGSGRVVARSGYTFSLEFEQIPYWALSKARQGRVAILSTESDDRVRALVQLNNFVNTYVFVGRFVDRSVIAHIERTREAVQAYQNLEGQRTDIEVTFALIFVVVALLVLFAAIWVGLTFTTRLARPIMRLIDASEKVRDGDLTVRVPEEPAVDELTSLARAFNRMTGQLASQRQELVDANRVLDERRRFTETVLAGVTAGVVGLDAGGVVTLANQSACALLAADPDDPEGLEGTDLPARIPEVGDMMQTVQKRPDRVVQGEVRLTRKGQTRTLFLRLVPERLGHETVGFVVTFDDITDLLAAQRKAAWADVARRIAHEIKNPLTPIQLSAERLKRKYLRQIESDPETFTGCTDTILRHVGDIRRMVDEFSAFARMPSPEIGRCNLADMVRNSALAAHQGRQGVEIVVDLPETPQVVACDERLAGQAVINLVKNAEEAIAGRAGAGETPSGHITVRVEARDEGSAVVVEDDGPGLPDEALERLTEPYVTTREKGTGLGLAIVKKIMEEHGGDLLLHNRPDGPGARVTLVFPERSPTGAAPESEGGEAGSGTEAEDG